MGNKSFQLCLAGACHHLYFLTENSVQYKNMPSFQRMRESTVQYLASDVLSLMFFNFHTALARLAVLPILSAARRLV